jgi:hypothetical protein
MGVVALKAEGGFNFLAALNRRRALARLGLGVAAVYVAPVALKLSEASTASGDSAGAGTVGAPVGA